MNSKNMQIIIAGILLIAFSVGTALVVHHNDQTSNAHAMMESTAMQQAATKKAATAAAMKQAETDKMAAADAMKKEADATPSAGDAMAHDDTPAVTAGQ